MDLTNPDNKCALQPLRLFANATKTPLIFTEGRKKVNTENIFLAGTTSGQQFPKSFTDVADLHLPSDTLY
jgi:hypothetical protein